MILAFIFIIWNAEAPVCWKPFPCKCTITHRCSAHSEGNAHFTCPGALSHCLSSHILIWSTPTKEPQDKSIPAKVTLAKTEFWLMGAARWKEVPIDNYFQTNLRCSPGPIKAWSDLNPQHTQYGAAVVFMLDQAFCQFRSTEAFSMTVIALALSFLSNLLKFEHVQFLELVCLCLVDPVLNNHYLAIYPWALGMEWVTFSQ